VFDGADDEYDQGSGAPHCGPPPERQLGSEHDGEHLLAKMVAVAA
jgi:hypothetical protein